MHGVVHEKAQPLNVKLQRFKPVPSYRRVEDEYDWNRKKYRHEMIELELWSNSPTKRIGVMDILTAKQDYIRHGFVLAPLEDDKHEKGAKGSCKKELDDAAKPPKYVLVEVDTTKVPTNLKMEVKNRGSKILCIPTNISKTLHIHRLQRGWHFIKARLRFEFHVTVMTKSGKRFTGGKNAKNTAKGAHHGTEMGYFDWKDEQNHSKLDLHPAKMFHLLPDIIQRAMPDNLKDTSRKFDGIVEHNPKHAEQVLNRERKRLESGRLLDAEFDVDALRNELAGEKITLMEEVKQEQEQDVHENLTAMHATKTPDPNQSLESKVRSSGEEIEPTKPKLECKSHVKKDKSQRLPTDSTAAGVSVSDESNESDVSSWGLTKLQTKNLTLWLKLEEKIKKLQNLIACSGPHRLPKNVLAKLEKLEKRAQKLRKKEVGINYLHTKQSLSDNPPLLDATQTVTGIPLNDRKEVLKSDILSIDQAAFDESTAGIENLIQPEYISRIQVGPAREAEDDTTLERIWALQNGDNAKSQNLKAAPSENVTAKRGLHITRKANMTEYLQKLRHHGLSRLSRRPGFATSSNKDYITFKSLQNADTLDPQASGRNVKYEHLEPRTKEQMSRLLLKNVHRSFEPQPMHLEKGDGTPSITPVITAHSYP